MAVTWETFRFSSSSNTNMIDYSDMWTLGRVPVVARMLGTDVAAGGLQVGDVLLFLLALAAVLWGVAVGLSVVPGRPVRSAKALPWRPAMLAIAGSSLFLASVLVAGFGWAYKATFLLLAVPLVSGLVRAKSRVVVSSSVTVLLLTGVTAVVVWNTVLATLAGIVVAAFVLGLAGAVLVRSVRESS
jgi:NADH:ubiquinone oxidoreductase subunit K